MRLRFIPLTLSLAALSACGGAALERAAPANTVVPAGANPAAFQAPVHGVITAGEAERPGVDARKECAGGDVTRYVSTLTVPGTEPQLLDGFRTDEAGYLHWNADVLGSTILGKYTSENTIADSTWVLCWFSGTFAANGQDVGPELTELPSVLVAANTLEGRTSVHLVAAKDNVMAILAPRPSAQAQDAGLRTRRPSQPQGVVVLEERTQRG